MWIYKRPTRENRRKSEDSKEVLDRLEAYLNENTEEPAKFLVRFWEDQSNVFTYKEIREAILAGVLTVEYIKQWQQDYSVLVAEKMTPLWQDAIEAGTKGQPVMDALTEMYVYEPTADGVISWIKNRGASFVTNSTDEQRKAIASLLLKTVDEEYSVDELARLIRPCIGLTKDQTSACVKYYENIKAALKEKHPKMKASSVQEKAREATVKYASKLHRQRAFVIAQTELSFAYNRGADEAIRQAQAQNLLGEMEKRWSTSGDNNVCSICAALEGVQIGMNETFNFPGRILYEGHKLTPPAHPRCGCAVEYIEIRKPSPSAV